MDVRYINPFIQSVKKVYSTMLSTDILISKPYVKTDTGGTSDVSAVIGLSGDVVGSVALCFPLETAVKSAGKFAGIPMSKDHEDFADALGELANMVAGSAKSQLEGFNVSISLPNVIVGKNHVVSQSKHTPRLALPCDSSLGRFSVEVAMVMKKPTAQTTPKPAMASVGA
ncbi:MAG: chemotaxis protein CheX [Phycisphaerae bacterium]|nr:chemotaxis protein CheX [Phycisphaerae bacterium]